MVVLQKVASARALLDNSELAVTRWAVSISRMSRRCFSGIRVLERDRSHVVIPRVNNPTKHSDVKKELGQQFIDWLVSADGQQSIANYKIDGEQLFYPDAA